MDKGYGLLYTDGKPSEASSIRGKINIKQDDVDAYGFISLGVNNNQPLFFRVKKDTSYPRGAYYVHGVYYKGDPSYYADGRYERDMFTEFIGQQELDAMRTAKTAAPEPTVNAELLGIKQRLLTDKGLCKELLVRLYSEEKLLLSVRDDLYSNDYARLFLRDLFVYLTPSLRKSCSYITGVTDQDRLMPDIVIRIVPESALPKGDRRAISISEAGHVCSVDSEFGEVVDRILELSDESRRIFFQWYETLFNGFGSYYQARKFLDFWNACCGDAVLSEKILNAYLKGCADPQTELLPSFVVDALCPKYRSEDASPFRFVATPKFGDILSPYAYLDANLTEIKKLYLFMPEVTEQLFRLFAQTLSKTRIDDNAFSQIGEAFERKAWEPELPEGERMPTYLSCFRNAIKRVYEELLANRLQNYQNAKQVILKDVKRYFEVYREYLLSENKNAEYLQRIAAYINQQNAMSAEDKQALYEVCCRLTNEYTARHNEFCSKAFGFTVGVLPIGEDAVKGYHDIYTALKQRNFVVLPDLFRRVSPAFSAFPQYIDNMAARYTLMRSDLLAVQSDRVLSDFAKQQGRIREIAKCVAGENPKTAVYLLARYARLETVFRDLIRFVQKIPRYAGLSEEREQEIVQVVESIIRDRLAEQNSEGSGSEKGKKGKSNDTKRNAEIFGLPETPEDPEGRVGSLPGKLIILWGRFVLSKGGVKKLEKELARSTAGAGKSKKKHGVMIAVCCALAAVILAAILFVIFHFVLPGSGGEGESGGESSVAAEEAEEPADAEDPADAEEPADAEAPQDTEEPQEGENA